MLSLFDNIALDYYYQKALLVIVGVGFLATLTEAFLYSPVEKCSSCGVEPVYSEGKCAGCYYAAKGIR
jgi:hypothetical protein